VAVGPQPVELSATAADPVSAPTAGERIPPRRRIQMGALRRQKSEGRRSLKGVAVFSGPEGLIRSSRLKWCWRQPTNFILPS